MWIITLYLYVYIAQHIRYRTYCIPTANIFLGNPVPANYRESTRGAIEQRYIKKELPSSREKSTTSEGADKKYTNMYRKVYTFRSNILF